MDVQGRDFQLLVGGVLFCLRGLLDLFKRYEGSA